MKISIITMRQRKDIIMKNHFLSSLLINYNILIFNVNIIIISNSRFQNSFLLIFYS